MEEPGYSTVWLGNVQPNFYALSVHVGAFSKFQWVEQGGKVRDVDLPSPGPRMAFGVMDTRGGEGQVIVAVIDTARDRHRLVCPSLRIDFGGRHVPDRVQVNASKVHPTLGDKQAAQILFDILMKADVRND